MTVCASLGQASFGSGKTIMCFISNACFFLEQPFDGPSGQPIARLPLIPSRAGASDARLACSRVQARRALCAVLPRRVGVLRVSEGAPTYVRRDPMFPWARVIFPAVPHDLADPVTRARELIAAQGPIIHKQREREIRLRCKHEGERTW